MKFGRKFFGLNPRDVYSEIKNNEEIYNKNSDNLKKEIEKVSEALEKSEKELEGLKNQLALYHEREQVISQVLVTAQLNAQKIELEARENARIMLEKCNAELQVKNRELEKLRNKVARFKEEFKDLLDKYRYSIDSAREITGEPVVQPVNNDNVRYISGSDS